MNLSSMVYELRCQDHLILNGFASSFSVQRICCYVVLWYPTFQLQTFLCNLISNVQQPLGESVKHTLEGEHKLAD